MRKIEDITNFLSDMDAGWWPVLFLRPSKNQEIKSSVVLKISLLFGTPAGLLFFYLFVVHRHLPITAASLIANLILGIIVYFFLYKCSFANCWNRRARRLQAVQAAGVDKNNE